MEEREGWRHQGGWVGGVGGGGGGGRKGRGIKWGGGGGGGGEGSKGESKAKMINAHMSCGFILQHNALGIKQKRERKTEKKMICKQCIFSPLIKAHTLTKAHWNTCHCCSNKEQWKWPVRSGSKLILWTPLNGIVLKTKWFQHPSYTLYLTWG